MPKPGTSLLDSWIKEALSIDTDVVEGALRHLTALMDEYGLLQESTPLTSRSSVLTLLPQHPPLLHSPE